MEVSNARRRVLRFGAAAIVAAGAPIAFSPTHVVTVSNACAQAMLTGTCCPTQTLSWCNAGGQDHQGYYYLSTGACP